MNCQDFWERAPEYSRAEAGTGEWAGHLGECPACAAEWARQRNVAAGLRQLATQWSHLEAPARVEARLVRALRATSAGSERLPQPRFWIAAVAWATVSVAVMALALFLVHVREPQTAPKRIPANLAILASVEALPEDPAGETDSSVLGPGFLPLPNAERIAANEPVDLIRLEVPRSAMIALGFEVSPDRAAEPVEAEVAFGVDGVARAVRFLDGSF